MAAIEVKIKDKDAPVAEAIEEELKEFEQFFSRLPSPVGGPLTRPEKALLWAYLRYKIEGVVTI